MVRSAVLGLCMVAGGAVTAHAGAWPRAPGTGFLATSGTVTQENDLTGSLYAEYGLTHRLTFGLDIDGRMDRIGVPAGEGIAFLQFALSAPEATHKWAAHAGIGARYENSEFFFAQEVGVSWGRGFQFRDQFGWVAVDGSVNFAADPLHRITKLDTTVGIGISDRAKIMGQVYLTHTQGDLFKTLAPSLLISQKEGPFTLQIGVEFPLDNAGDNRLKIGIWRNF